jgi:hypothetical protein
MKRRREEDEENANLPSVSLLGARMPRNLDLHAGAFKLIL